MGAKRKIDKKLGKKRRRRTEEIDRSNELVFFVRAGYDQRPAGSTRDTGVVGGLKYPRPRKKKKEKNRKTEKKENKNKDIAIARHAAGAVTLEWSYRGSRHLMDGLVNGVEVAL